MHTLHTFFVESNRLVINLCCVIRTFARVDLLQRFTFLKGDVLIMQTDLSLCARCVDRLRQLVGLYQSFRQFNTAYGAVL